MLGTLQLATADLYRWSNSNRPALALDEALKMGRKALGKDWGRFYCTGVRAFGSRERGGDKGGWNITYASTDGAVRNFNVSMEGDGNLEETRKAFRKLPKPERSAGVSEVREKIEKICAEYSIPIDQVLEEEGKLLITGGLRQYSLHEKAEDGSFSEEAVLVEGPGARGIWINVTVQEGEPTSRAWWERPVYWEEIQWNFLLKEDRKFLRVIVRSGNNFEPEVKRQIMAAFGKPVKSQ